MTFSTVRARLIIGFSAVILLMVALCVFAYTELYQIRSQAIALTADSVPGLSIIGKLDSASISAQAAFGIHAGDQNDGKPQMPGKGAQQDAAAITALVKEYESTVATSRDREVYDKIKAAVTPYISARNRLLRLGSEANSKAEPRGALFQDLESSYEELRTTVQAAVDFERSNADQSGHQIQDAVAKAQTAILAGLSVALVLAIVAGLILLRSINRPLTLLVDAMQPMRRRGLFPEAGSAPWRRVRSAGQRL